MKKKSHLLKLLKMDLHRCIGAKRFPVIIALIVVLLIANVWESVMIELQYKMRMMGSLEKLMELLIFDRFKAEQLHSVYHSDSLFCIFSKF